MHLKSITIEGFRCFGPTAVHCELADFTCFIGPNGAGKTALLLALCRMFGVEAADRRVRASDFFVPSGANLNDEDSRTLRIEARFDVEPEGDDGNDDASATAFTHMVVEEPEGTPFVRIELLATWTNDGTLEGDVEQQLSWITTTLDQPAEMEKARRKMAAADRSLIRAIYISDLI